MMMGKIRNYFRDERGVAAVEMALISPFVVGFAVMSINVWDVGMRKQDMRGALKLATQYYLNGGTNDTAAVAVALDGWNHKPAVSSVVATRVYRCGSAVSTDATTPCADGLLPAIYVYLQASATTSSAILYQTQTAEEYVRVR